MGFEVPLDNGASEAVDKNAKAVRHRTLATALLQPSPALLQPSRCPSCICQGELPLPRDMHEFV
jgi:hypothetical protein